MMSIDESHAEQGEDKKGATETKAMGLSAFKATQSGLSQASLCFGKTIHNSNFRNVA